MWQSVLKGAVANVLIDWTELKYYGNITIDDGSTRTIPLPRTLIDKLEVKYSIGINKELTKTDWDEDVEGITISFHNAKVRITLEGQTLESDISKTYYNKYDEDSLTVKPSYISMTIAKRDGKYEIVRRPTMAFDAYDLNH